MGLDRHFAKLPVGQITRLRSSSSAGHGRPVRHSWKSKPAGVGGRFRIRDGAEWVLLFLRGMTTTMECPLTGQSRLNSEAGQCPFVCGSIASVWRCTSHFRSSPAPNKRTFSESVNTSQKCQLRSLPHVANRSSNGQVAQRSLQ